MKSQMNTHGLHGLPFQLSSFAGQLLKLSHFKVTHHQTVSIVIWDPKKKHQSCPPGALLDQGPAVSCDFSNVAVSETGACPAMDRHGNFNGNRLNGDIFGYLIFSETRDQIVIKSDRKHILHQPSTATDPICICEATREYRISHAGFISGTRDSS